MTHPSKPRNRARIHFGVVALLVGAGILAVWSATDAVYAEGNILSLYDGRNAIGVLMFIVAFVVWMLDRIENEE